MRDQAARVWGPFQVEANGITYAYEFDFHIAMASTMTPVRRFVRDTNADRDREVPEESARPIVDAFAEANAARFANIALVHTALRGNACAPCIQRPGGLVAPSAPRAEHPGVLTRTSNAMVLHLGAIQEADNRTVAHELGHMLGMADFNYQGPDLMARDRHRGDSVRRLTDRDKERFHDVLAVSPLGVRWVGGRPPEPHSRRRDRRRVLRVSR